MQTRMDLDDPALARQSVRRYGKQPLENEHLHRSGANHNAALAEAQIGFSRTTT